MRTLLGQSGLVFILLNYYMFSVINFIFPKHIVENQEISLHKIATGTINWREGLQLLGKSVAVCCGFFCFRSIMRGGS